MNDAILREPPVENDIIGRWRPQRGKRLALAGALDTLLHHHPRLALCIYHLWDDALEIPRLIRASGGPYRYEFK
jgi:hypothetical protein